MTPSPTAPRRALEEARANRREIEHVMALNRPFRLNTAEENQVLTTAFWQASNLAPDAQFVRNAYGLPFMPVPNRRVFDGLPHSRQAPENVTHPFFGHPVFWVDPDLTAPTEAETHDSVAWAVRIWLLLVEMGLMNDEGRWTNVVDATIGEYTTDDMEVYFKGEATRFDDVWYDADHLHLTDADRTQLYAGALDRIIDIQRRARLEFTQQQDDAMRLAQVVMDDDTRWTNLVTEAQHTTWAVRRDGQAGRSVAAYVPQVENITSRVIDHLTAMDSAAARLHVHGLEQGAFSTTSYSRLLSLARHIDGPKMRQVYSEKLKRLVDGMFSGAGGYTTDTEQWTEYTKQIEAFYQISHDRLELASRNYAAMTQRTQGDESTVDAGDLFESELAEDDELADLFDDESDL